MNWKRRVAVALASLMGVLTTSAIGQVEPSTSNSVTAAEWRINWQRGDALFASRAVAGFAQREYYARLLVAAPAEAMLALLLDTQQVPNWVHHATQAKVLHQFGLDHYLVYSQYSPPWPVRNRDLVSESRHWQGDQGIWLQAQARPSLMANQPGYLRVQQMQTCWYAKRLDEQRSELHYLGYIQDPGILPALVINPAQQMVLEKTLEKLTARIVDYDKADQQHWQFEPPSVIGYCQQLQQLIGDPRWRQ